MPASKIDRRVARTRATLHHALMALILAKKYDDITVEEICQAADIGRSTFYAHFTSKDDLRRHGLDQMRKHIIEEHRTALALSAPARSPLAFSLTMFTHARNHLDRYRALVGAGTDGAGLDVIRRTLAQLLGEELAAAGRASKNGAPREIVIQFVVGAYMAVLTSWLDEGAKLPPKRIDAIFRRIALQGIAAL